MLLSYTGALKQKAGEKMKDFWKYFSGFVLSYIKMQCNTGRNSVKPHSSIFENLTHIFIVSVYITPVCLKT